MAVGDSPILDDFNRANEGPPLSASWTTIAGGLRVSTNRARADISSRCWEAYETTYGPDCEVYCAISGLPDTNNEMGVFARATTLAVATIDCYFLEYGQLSGTDTVTCYRVDNGAFTQLGSAVSRDFAAGEGLLLYVSGTSNNLTGYYNAGAGWISLGTTWSDGAHTAAGYPGLSITNITGRAEDFGGGTLSASGITISVSESVAFSESLD